MAPLVDMSHPSPVFRPVEVFSLVKNGVVSSEDRAVTLQEAMDRDLGRVVVWRVSSGPDPQGWAAIRLDIPKQAAGEVLGVRYLLRSSGRVSLSLDAYIGVIGPNFYGSRPLGSVRRTLDAGVHHLVFRFSDATPTPGQVEGFGLSVTGALDAPVELSVSRIDLILPSARQARRFASEPVLTAVDILKARRIDLGGLAGTRSPAELDRLCWQGFHLAAMGEQLRHWSALSRKLSLPAASARRLERERLALVARLQQGSSVEDDLRALQGDIDAWIDHLLRTVPADSRRWRLGSDGRFRYPDGRPMRMLAVYPARLDFPARGSRMMSTWDIRYIAGLGFNGIRLAIAWSTLEPERGRFTRWYLDELKWIARECERYGLGLSVDLHFPRPAWFLRGAPGLELTAEHPATHAQAYHWPEALADTWGRLAAEFRDVPNVVAWEVPVNEPMIVTGSHGISAYPALVRSWNSWLRQTYGTRDALREAWGSGDDPERYGLRDDEDWDSDTIRWMLLEERPDAAAEHLGNPRLWDHLRWTAFLQRSVTESIMREIRRHVPDAVGMMHRTIGDNWDGCPVPIDYTCIETVRGSFVQPGTHYGIAGLSARRAASQTMASYDTEQHVRGAQLQVEEHVRLGLGLCAFWFSHAGYDHETMLRNACGHVQPDTAFIARRSEWMRSYWPRDSGAPRVAVVLSTRLEAVRRSRLGRLVEMLEGLRCRVSVFNGLEVVLRPELLDGHAAVITPGAFMDVGLLGVLQEKYSGSVLIHGSLERDALARRPERGLAAEFVRRGLLLGTSRVGPIGAGEESRIDLTGEWDFLYTRQPSDPRRGPPADGRPEEWTRMPVPGLWDGSGVLAFTATTNVLGDGWYRRRVFVPDRWEGRSVSIVFGSIDDYDRVYVNGRLIGRTDERTPGAAGGERRYTVPHGVIRPGRENEIHVLVRNVAGDGGVPSGPVELRADRGWLLPGPGGEDVIAVGDSATRITREMLHPGAGAVMSIRSGPEECVALARQGRWWWWVSDLPWTGLPHEIAVLRAALGPLLPR